MSIRGCSLVDRMRPVSSSMLFLRVPLNLNVRANRRRDDRLEFNDGIVSIMQLR